MTTLLVYETDEDPPTHRDDLIAELESLGVDLEPGEDYRPGRWRDAHTGSWITVDIGDPRLERDDLHPATAYPGWRPVPLVLHIPLSVAHWQAVEAFAFVERLLARLPHLAVLDTEDNRQDEDGEAGPFPFQRLRALGAWERAHAAQTAGRNDLPRLARPASLALWRYRRERAAGETAHPEAVWPEALVVAEGPTAHSVAFWADRDRPLALPPVGYLILTRPDSAGLIPVDEILTAADGGEALEHGAARLIRPGGALRDLYDRARLMPTERFAGLADGDWSD